MSAVETAMSIASIINFIALLLLLQAVIKNRNGLKGYSITGSFLTFVSLCGFEVAYYLMNNLVSLILGFAAVIFWLIAFIYTFKQKLSSTKPKNQEA